MKKRIVHVKLVCNHVTRPTKIVGKDGKPAVECVLCFSFPEDES